MSYRHFILPEYDQEMANTRKVLEVIPEDKWDWKPVPTVNTIGWNANHLAEMPTWIDGTLNSDSWDFAPVGGERYKSPSVRGRQAVLDHFDRNVAAGRKALEGIRDDAQMDEPWSLLEGGKAFFTLPRSWVIRNFVMNHLVHHRAMLISYLRQCGVDVPGMYGP